ncbi:MAG TPA: hypothetical protein VEQ37_01295 [Actinomycetota bacterium]|nr:hypothetical protein [Actinomycetota bacterium]
MRVGAAIVALGLIAVGAVVLISRGGGTSAGPSHPPPPTSPPPPSREAFAFPLSKTHAVATGKGNAAETQRAAAGIQTTLSAFYDAAFMDPKARQQGLPAGAWNAFAQPIQEQAKSDAGSLTLGEAGRTIDQLSVTDASLSVRVLLDPSGHPQAAIANVTFDASGKLTGGEAVLVSNRASFLLRPAPGGRWLVYGYPNAKTEVEAPSPTPSPSASGSPMPTSSASPSSGASP